MLTTVDRPVLTGSRLFDARADGGVSTVDSLMRAVPRSFNSCEAIGSQPCRSYIDGPSMAFMVDCLFRITSCPLLYLSKTERQRGLTTVDGLVFTASRRFDTKGYGPSIDGRPSGAYGVS